MVSCLGMALAIGQSKPGSLIYSGDYQNGAFESLTFVNPVVGWDLFFNSGFRGQSTVIGNVEAGLVWSGHEVFIRPAQVTTGLSTYTNMAVGALNEVDYHATTVGHILAGSGYRISDDSYTYVGLGMAPEATLISAGIATEFSAVNPGEFQTSTQSVVNAYRALFQGVGVAKADVINSSWGGDDPSASSAEPLAIDGLARQNASVAFVVSAGNGGSDTVSSPASGFNNISVGSLGGASFLEPSSFSSSGLTDFYNPKTLETITGVRAAVDIAAPGERLALAAYLGNSGTIGASLPELIQEPSPTDLYFLNMDGTSFAAPIVAGGIALLKDAGNTLLAGNANASDTRVIKSVLMASAQKTIGWDNGQDGFNVTTQVLDPITGAGAMDLVAAADVYYFGTQDVAGSAGGEIESVGWESATIDLGEMIEYKFNTEFREEMTLTVALNWFAVSGFDNTTEVGSAIAFSNLDLEVWSLDSGGAFESMVGSSMSTYNNTEFLRIASLAAGNYGLRVVFDSIIYDMSDAVTSENYGLAWRAVAVPEPSVAAMFGVLLVFLWRRRMG